MLLLAWILEIGWAIGQILYDLHWGHAHPAEGALPWLASDLTIGMFLAGIILTMLTVRKHDNDR